MNALRIAIQRNTVLAGRRFASAAPAFPKPPLVPECYTSSFKKDFLSDPSTYPLIFVLCSTTCIILGMSTNALSHYKDLRITPSHKHQILRDWGDKHTDTVTQHLANMPIVMHGNDYRSTWQEGLGIDHEEWKKGKEAYLNVTK